MELSPRKVKDKLLDALDKEYNVLDMDAVIEVINLLEKITVSKDLLEETRLGKHINELRKKTKDVTLAKRAKNLVRKWRSFILPVDKSINKVIVLNGAHSNHANGNANNNRRLAGIVSKPVSPNVVTIGLSSASNSPSSMQHSRMGGLHHRVSSPPVVVKARPFEGIGSANCNSLAFKPIKPASPASKPSISPCNVDNRSSSPFVANHGLNSSPPSSRTCSPFLQQISHSTSEVDRTNAANKRLRKDGAHDSNGTSFLNQSTDVVQPNGLNNFSVNTPKSNKKRRREVPEPMESFNKKLAVHVKTQKVKTTAQLIADLQARNNNCPIIKGGDTVLSEIRQNSKFVGADGVSLGRHPALTDSVADIKKTKSELMEKFLSSAPSPIPMHDLPPDVEVSPPSPEKPPPPVLSFGEKLTKLLDQLPPIDKRLAHEEAVADNECDAVAPAVVVNVEDTRRLHEEEWPEVNGTLSADDHWTGWHELTTKKSYNDQILNVLPYVDID